MIYNDFKGKKISALGLGCMRLPTIDGNDSHIDIQKTEEMIDFAIKSGVNYFDTAWGYHGGKSEETVGEILSKYPRDSYCIASKFPGYDLANMDKISEIFPEQLKRCKVDRFDFYLFHNVCETNIDAYLDKKYGILEYLLEQKKNKKITHIGFSVHGNIDTTRRFLSAYGEHIDFCQIQLNYLDLTYQDAKAKLELLAEYNIPVFVMEPLRGGKLASLSEQYMSQLKVHREDENAVGWAFSFLQSYPQVIMTLSGMSSLMQLEENIGHFSDSTPLTDAEMSTLLLIADDMINNRIIPCTKCKYCISHCPLELNIPYLLKLYNDTTFSGGSFTTPRILKKAPKNRLPSACLGCRNCEAVCPQNIKISDALHDFAEKISRDR